jgi:hypothetical protein
MMVSRERNLFIASVLLVLILFLTGIGYPADLIVYLHPKGNDQADGLTKETAVASLQIAIDNVLQRAESTHDRLRIIIEPGTYLGQIAVTKGSPEGKPLVISPDEGGEERPRFDGNGKGGTWLKLDNAAGKPTRLTVEGLEISNYLTAISLNGRRTSEVASNSHNMLRNNIFRNIGQVANPTAEPSTAAVRLVNSDDNQIMNNRFINIRNFKRCGSLHAIYIAHYSTGNHIAENIFDGGCGATIKVRDGSSNNVIENNEFLNQEEAVFLDGFCDKSIRGDCTKEEAECPSWNNEFRGNKISGLGRQALNLPVAHRGSDQPSGCPSPASGSLRVKQTGNVLR